MQRVGVHNPASSAPVITAVPLRLQPKLRVGPVDDPLEREADRIADQVVTGSPIGAIGSAEPGGAQRKCAACEAEEQETVQRRAASSATPGNVNGVAAGLSQAGVPLSPAERSYFEPRFGRDFSGVRLHTDGEAASAASTINARAFTLGRDIAFANGEYKPDTGSGRQLMAHELAHTLQQDSASTPTIRRASYGSGTPPVWANSPLSVVPQSERALVDEAMAIIDRIVAGTGSHSECHDHFAKNCPSGTSGTLASTWQRATIWRDTNASATENASGTVNGTDIAYTGTGYGQGAEGLAGTLLHESGHNCGIPGGSTHWLAAQIRSYCIGPGRNDFSITAGGYLGGEGAIAMLSYRRLLGDLASGRFRFTLGADLNIAGALGASAGKPGEVGSAMVGGQLRLGGWGGSSYGGFGLRFETGFGVGQFSMRRATPDDASPTATGAGWVLQIGPRAEFLVKMGDEFVFPFTVSAALRMMQPLNGEARALHGIVGSIEIPF